MLEAILYAALAGAMIPLGGVLARAENIRPRWLEQEFRHSVIAFGGGALLAAVALVLVPQGAEAVPVPVAVLAFGAGGILFAAIDHQLKKEAGPRSQLLAMVADFVPEAMALGALFAAGSGSAPLLALLIAMQNLPEGFNAYREQRAGGAARTSTLALFVILALLGPVAAVLGNIYLSEAPAAMGTLMLVSAGGILYLIFEDIAPQTPLRRAWAPPLGAVAGFALGLAGHLLIH